MTPAASPRAADALTLVRRLQARMHAAQTAVADAAGDAQPFTRHHWLRDHGAHGGGDRWGISRSPTFDRGAINVSQVHYDDAPTRALASATALSTIIHPRHPHAPSVHVHVSWTEMRDGQAYWRVMADLNPSQVDDPFVQAAAAQFTSALRTVSGAVFAEAQAQGDRYFYIPAAGRTRGVSHFYLEQFATADPAADAALAEAVAGAAIDTHAALVAQALAQPATDAARAAQLAYHSLYVLQVLTLDRGTTSGLLVHDQNDVGILGSLPSDVEPARIRGWRDASGPRLAPLVEAIAAALGPATVSDLNDDVRVQLAGLVRGFFRAHPEALDDQARGDRLPPTVANHR